jgi:RHS repeat-associated protein
MKRTIQSKISESLLVVCNRIVFINLCLLLVALIFSKSADAGSFSATLGGDGIVKLSGSESFECVPEGYSFGSAALVNLYSSPPNGDNDGVAIIYGSTSASFADVEYNLSCRYPGNYRFSVDYMGGKWNYDHTLCLMEGTPRVFADVNLPKGREITIESNNPVRGVETIGVTYNFSYSAALVNNDRQISVRIDNTLVYSAINLPVNGSIPITYDFSNKKGFVVIKASACCSGHCRTTEKLVYTEPEDSCPIKVGKPVSVASGNVYTSENDFTLKGIMPISFTRYYDSAESITRGFGQAWGHTYDTRVVNVPNSVNIYKVINPDGSDVYYIDNDGDKVYYVEYPKGEKSRLIKNANNSLVREYFDGRKEEFNSYGYMTAVVDGNGNRITLTRGSNNKLTQITDPSGRVITVSYYPSTSTKITSITLPDGKTINYTYGTYLSKVIYPDSRERNYEYIYKTGVGWRLSGLKNENGVYIEKHDYDVKGRATTSSADGTNDKLTINYLSDTQSTVTDSLNRMTTYTIDKTLGQSHPTNISGPGCKSCGQGDTSRTYDDKLNVTSITDANGHVTTMTYDANGNMLTRTEAYGTAVQRTTTYTYNSFGQVLTETGNDGIITSYTYNTNGNMLSKIEAYGTADERTTTYTYNAYGQLLTVTDPNGNITTNTYDQYGNLASATNAFSQAIAYTYDVMGNPLSMTEANGNITSYEYDSKYRLKKETRPDTGVINYEYDPAGNRTAIIDANGNRTTSTYDTINRLIKTTDAAGSTTNYTYDTEGNMSSMTIKDSAGNVKTSETYTYDDHNRLTRTTHADGTYKEQSYDALGNVLTKRDENGNVTTNAYDALNRLQSVTDQSGGITSYTYDSRNNLTSITDANGNVTIYSYDSLNRLISITSPDTGTTTYTYDHNGNMITKTDANGVTMTYAYDALNRQAAIQFPDTTQNITYTYDNAQYQNNIGRLSAMTDPSGTTSYDYDTMGRIRKETKQTGGVQYITEYTYDPYGNLLTATYPGGRVITYTYNQLNKVTSVTDTYLGVTRTLANNITYQPVGDIASMTHGNGVVTTKTYNNRYQLNGLNIGNLKQFAYTRDNAGNITAITDTLNPLTNKSYTYDNLYRLTLANGQWGSLTYAYNPVGNRTYETTSTGNTSYTYTANTNKLASASGEKAFSFSYDNNGNTTTENNKLYIYSQNQRLIEAIQGSNVLADYIYNAKGQRVKKTVNGQITIFNYDQNGLMISESTSTGTITSEYAYLNGQPLAKIENNNIYYYHNDHLGTPVLMTNGSGNTVWQGEFKPFGEPMTVTGSITNNLRFPGQYYDSETGLRQNWFRDYRAEVGRYVQPDPILLLITKLTSTGCAKTTVTWHMPRLMTKPQMMYTYVYAVDNPIIFTDPTGQNIYGNWCGPGGSGPTINGVDGCCKEHDDCYKKSGASWKNSVLGTGSSEKQKCIKDCDKELCKCLKKYRPINFDELTGQQEVMTWFGCK